MRIVYTPAPVWILLMYNGCACVFISLFVLTASWHLPLCQVLASRYSSGTAAIVQGQLRGLLSPKVNTLPLVRSIGRTMTQGKTYGPQITVKRISTRWRTQTFQGLVQLLHAY